MKDWKKVLVAPGLSIRDTVRVIEAGNQQIALVVGEGGHLLGTVTDGDVRRGILQGAPLDGPVAAIMNDNPVTAAVGDNPVDILYLMKRLRISQVPLVDEAGVLQGLETLSALLAPRGRENTVVLMAGGLGSRLGSLTRDVPKPLLQVGDRPILETILTSFAEAGFQRFYISVNYKAEMVCEHFGDGSRWGVEIDYLHEPSRLGTVGALSLLPEKPTAPVIVMNGDIMTRVNFPALLDFHARNKAAATVCVREFTNTVPYGVVRMQDARLTNIVEKPSEKVFVLAGIYVLSPQLVDMIPPGEYCDMPDLLQAAMGKDMPVVGFPIHEYWLDIGRLEDFQRAHQDYWSTFAA